MIRESYRGFMPKDVAEPANPPSSSSTRALASRFAQVDEKAMDFMAAGVPANTSRTYESQWRMFAAWCRDEKLCALPATAETVVRYLTIRAENKKVSTLNVAIAAITAIHRKKADASWEAEVLPYIQALMRGVKKKKGAAPKKKQAFLLVDLQRGLPEGSELKPVRDRAILLLAFFSALRRSELVALTLEDLQETADGIQLYVRTSKTDQEAKGQSVFVPYLNEETVCPVRALRAWIKQSAVESGPLFFSVDNTRFTAATIAAIVKGAAEKAGFDPAAFGAHSLRSGFATSAAKVKAEERDIMTVTRHKSERTLRGYIQEATLGENHPGRAIAAALKKEHK